MQKDLNIATAQFENRSGDKAYNLEVMRRLSAGARAAGADVISFHECSVTGYSFARKLSRDQLLDIAEYIPAGDSVAALVDIARETGMVVMAGLFEKDARDNLFKAYVCVNGNGMIACHRKLHPFIHPDIRPGNAYTVFQIQDWACGILICYDSNIIENVRATKLLGADIFFMPHVTMCTPSTRPGAGFVDPALWHNRTSDPTSLRKEFDGLKGRAWLMKWLPSRAYDNAAYVIFSNPIGMDDDQLKNGCSMIIDPFGEILEECRSFEDSFVMATVTGQKVIDAGGTRYLNARRPELYREIIGKPHQAVQRVSWMRGRP